MNHSHTNIKPYRKILVTGLSLNVVFVAIAIIFGLITNSSALLSDAGYRVLILISTWFAVTTAPQPPQKFIYGRLKRSTILFSIFGILLLLVATGFIGWEAWQKLFDTVEIAGTKVMIIASVGIAVNIATALLFTKGLEEEQSIKKGLLPVVISGVVSLSVVIAGLLIELTGYTWIDPAVSFSILFVIVYQSWKLFINLINRAMNAISKDINPQEVQYVLESLDGVQQVYDLDIWVMNTTEYVLSAHLVLRENYSTELLEMIKEELEDRFGITYTSIKIKIDRNSSTKKNTNGLP